MAEAVASLLQWSSEIVFVDQHFSCTAKHGKALTEFLSRAFTGKVVKRLEYHLNADAAADWFHQQLEKQRRYLSLPPGIQMRFYRWATIDGGDNMHARYILTELGGIRFEHGLDEASSTETTDVELISETIYKKRWEQFLPDSGTFRLVDVWIVTAERVVSG